MMELDRLDMEAKEREYDEVDDMVLEWADDEKK